MNCLRTILTPSAIVVAGLLMPGLASAAACSAFDLKSVSASYDALWPNSPGDLDTADANFRGVAADGCSGVYNGNDSDAQVKALITGMGWGDGSAYSDSVKADLPSDGLGVGIFGIDWQLSAGGGNWSLSFEADSAVSVRLDVVAVFKQARGWAAWFFTDEDFHTDGNASGTYEIEWCNGQPAANNGDFSCTQTDLSHLSLYFGNPREIPTNEFNVPLPGSTALLGIGLLAVGYRLRQR